MRPGRAMRGGLVRGRGRDGGKQACGVLLNLDSRVYLFEASLMCGVCKRVTCVYVRRV